MAVTLTFEIQLQSDYHSGAGHGLGVVVDSALLRDRDGIPVIRGTTIAGLLRDGLYRLLKLAPLAQQYPARCAAQGRMEKDIPRFCGQKDPTQLECPVCHVFGSPRTPKRWHFSSARPEQLTQAVTDEWAQARTGGEVVRRARIDPRTRRAEEGKLFTREVGDSRLRFVFTATNHELAGVEADIELLVAAARMVRNLGASRRRGQGACFLRLTRVEVDDQPLAVEQDTWLDRFHQRYIKKQTPASLLNGEPALPTLSLPSEGPPVRFWLLVRTEEPLLVAERSEAANQFDTRPLVPGTTVRGALAERIAARYPQVRQNSGPVYDTFVELFFRESVRFPFLYPCQHDPLHEPHVVYAMVPAPRDLLSCESYTGFRVQDGHHGAKGYATETQVPTTCGQCGQLGRESALKPLGDTYIPLRGAPKLVQPGRATEMHITLNPETGRVQRGELYGYMALETGQYFVGELWCTSQQAWEALRVLANLPPLGRPFTLHLGKAARRGYGRTTAWLLQQDERLWLPQPFAERVPTPEEPLTLTLLTDAIIQDAWGRFHTDFREDWLETTLGLKVEVIRQFVAIGDVNAFNAQLGLPRHRDVVIRAGSAVGLRLQEPLPSDWQAKLAQLERDGIGLRRQEGFGRLAFNHSVYRGNEGVAQYIALQPRNGQRLGTPADHPLSDEAAFRWQWGRTLDRVPRGAWEDHQGQFVQVGRLLHASQSFDLAMIDRMLGFLGEERNLLGQSLSGRQKVHFLQDEDEGKPGLEKVRELVRQLGETISNDASLSGKQRDELKQIGLMMLASKIAEVAGNARQQAGGGG